SDVCSSDLEKSSERNETEAKGRQQRMVVTQARDGGHGRSPAAVMTSAPPAPPPGKPSAGPAPVPSGSEAVPARTSRPAAPPVRLRDDTCREGLCPKYQRAMALLGKRWTWLVLRVLLDGPSR